MIQLRSICIVIALILPCSAFSKSIVVVGGGLSGLMAAYEIKKQIVAQKLGNETALNLYEAKDRLGGRVFTVKLNGPPIELGGENISDGGEALNFRRVASELKLNIKNHKGGRSKSILYDSSSKTHYEFSELRSAFPNISRADLVRTFEEGESQSKTAAGVLDYFFSKYPSHDPNTQRKLALIRQKIEQSEKSYEGGDPHELSSRYAHGSMLDATTSFLKARSRGGSEGAATIDGGNSRLALALAKRLKSHVHLSKPLVEIKRLKESGFQLVFKDGDRLETVRADIVVLTLPCKPYADIKFASDIIPQERLNKITSVGYGTHAKILVPGPAPKTNVFVQTDDLQIIRRPDDHWFFLYYSGDRGILRSQEEFQTMAKFAAETAGKYAPIDTSKEIVTPTKLFADIRNKSLGVSWATDPYTKGSYSYYSADLKNELETTIEVGGEKVLPLFAPVENRLFFAGEHTTIDQDIRGTMEAAVESGVRTARMIAPHIR